MKWVQRDGTDAIRRLKSRYPQYRDAKVGIALGMTGKGNSQVLTPENRRPEIETWATTPYVDLAKEVVLPLGGDTTYLLKNRSLFADHQYELLDTVGHIQSLRITDVGWRCRGQLITIGREIEKIIIALAEVGSLKQSVAFVANEWGSPTKEEATAYPGAESIIRKWLALEISYTALPMNVTCGQIAYFSPEDAESTKAALERKGFDHEALAYVGLAAPRKRRTVVVL